MNCLRTGVVAVVSILTVIAGACQPEESSSPPVSRAAPIIPLDTGTVVITTAADSFLLSVEIAETADQTRIGLMERETLPPEEGMIFLFAEPRESNEGFWMFRTRIPLDIAYLDAAGRIVAIHQMQPCASPYIRGCSPYLPGVPYQAAIEVNPGYFTTRGIGIGDRVELRRANGGWPESYASRAGLVAP